MSSFKKIQFECYVCQKNFVLFRSLKRHLFQAHPNESAVPKQPECLFFACPECTLRYQLYDSLKKHIVKCHSSPCLIDPYSVQKLICPQCNIQLNDLDKLKEHVAEAHPDFKINNIELLTSVTSSQLQKLTETKHSSKTAERDIECPMCHNCFSKKNIFSHFEMHGVKITIEKFQFENFSRFLEWKENIEMETKSFYPKQRKYVNKCVKQVHNKSEESAKSYHLFTCHRSGVFISRAQSRFPKVQKTCKIKGFCPARMNVIKHIDGTCSVTFTKTHVGHTSSGGFFRLSKKKKEALAMKHAAKIRANKIDTIKRHCYEVLDILSNGNPNDQELDFFYNIFESLGPTLKAIRDSEQNSLSFTPKNSNEKLSNKK